MPAGLPLPVHPSCRPGCPNQTLYYVLLYFAMFCYTQMATGLFQVIECIKRARNSRFEFKYSMGEAIPTTSAQYVSRYYRQRKYLRIFGVFQSLVLFIKSIGSRHRVPFLTFREFSKNASTISTIETKESAEKCLLAKFKLRHNRARLRIIRTTGFLAASSVHTRKLDVPPVQDVFGGKFSVQFLLLAFAGAYVVSCIIWSV